MAAAMPRRRFTVGDYHRKAEAGILGEDDRVELIAGEIVEMSPLGPKHMRPINLLTHIVVSVLRVVDRLSAPRRRIDHGSVAVWYSELREGALQ